MPVNTLRRDFGEAPPKVIKKPIEKPVLPKTYGVKNYKRS